MLLAMQSLLQRRIALDTWIVISFGHSMCGKGHYQINRIVLACEPQAGLRYDQAFLRTLA
jgi:hypothetical protein